MKLRTNPACSAAVLLILLAGCGGTEPERPSMMHQVLSALQIPEKAQRDVALGDACRESAAAGDIESVLLGLPKIADAKLRNEVTQECVKKFTEADRSDDAKRIAEVQP